MRSLHWRLTSVALLGVACAATAAERPSRQPPLAPGVQIQRGDPIPASQRMVPEPESFGVQDQDGDVVSYSDFMPPDWGIIFGTDTVSGLRWTNPTVFGGNPPLQASMNMLPNGAYAPLISVYYYDNNPDKDLHVLLCEAYRDFGGSHVSCFADFQSQGTPGMTHDFIVVPDAYRNFLRRRDADGDGDLDLVSYELIVYTNGEDGDTSIGAVRPIWFRQVSPAPATPTFDDVPATDPYFQFIEALSASGITAGCSETPALYCPDEPLTRRQMAVFLSKALGLHWPY